MEIVHHHYFWLMCVFFCSSLKVFMWLQNQHSCASGFVFRLPQNPIGMWASWCGVGLDWASHYFQQLNKHKFRAAILEFPFQHFSFLLLPFICHFHFFPIKNNKGSLVIFTSLKFLSHQALHLSGFHQKSSCLECLLWCEE